MKGLIIILLIASLGMATSVDFGISVGVEAGQEPVLIPHLTVGSTLEIGNDFCIRTFTGLIGYSNEWAYHAAAGLGYGPVRAGAVISDDGSIGSYVGFEPPLPGPGRISVKVLNIEGANPIITWGVTRTL